MPDEKIATIGKVSVNFICPVCEEVVQTKEVIGKISEAEIKCPVCWEETTLKLPAVWVKETKAA